MKNNQIKLVTLVMDTAIILGLLFRKYVFAFMELTCPECFYSFTGLPCPTCGGTRCVRAILDLDLAGAISHNAFVFILALYAVVLVLVMNLCFAFGVKRLEPIFRGLFSFKVLFIMIGVYFVNWIGMIIFTVCV